MRTLDVDFLRQLLKYDPETGTFWWLMRRGGTAKAGDVAGCTKAGGYRVLVINNRHYMAHRVAWALGTGVYPTLEIDHINGDPSDNRLCNLREATRAQNSFNGPIRTTNKSGFKGVCWSKKEQLWRSTISVAGKQICLGYHKTPEKAHAAYCRAADRIHGQFARHG
jgi:hypothetical protein